MRILLLTLLCLISVFSHAQKTWDENTLKAANTASKVAFLTEEEKRVVFYLNLVRLEPQLFKETILKTYLDSLGKKDDKWIKSLKADLQKAKSCKPLVPRKNLTEVALKHASDMGITGKTGHVSSSGVKYPERIKSLKNQYALIFENCQYGYQDGLSVVIDLLIDTDVANFGHRKTILNCDLQFVGVSIQLHNKFRTNTVIEYADREKK